MNRVIHLFKKIVFILSIAGHFLHKFSRDKCSVERFFKCFNKELLSKWIL